MSNFTQKAIIDTFSEMIAEKPFNKITVKELVERCGINRNTFYYHFPDLPALVEEILKIESDNVIRNKTNIESPQEIVRVTIDFAKKNRAAAMHIYNSVNREFFEVYLDRICEYSLKGYIDYLSKGYPVSESDKAVIILFYKCAVIGLVLDWLKHGMNDDVDSISQRLLYLLEGTTMRIIEKACNGANGSNDRS